MKRKKNGDRQQRPQSSARPKISQNLWEFAGDFIRMGETLEQRQSYLNAACSAWNNHWAIENTLHWSLDMTYREDESRVRNRTFADNLSWLRRLTLSLIKQHPGKQSNIMKRRMAGWSVDFLMQILTGKGN